MGCCNGSRSTTPGSAADSKEPAPMIRILVTLCIALLFAPGASAQFDPSHAAWDALLKKHVRWLPDNKQSRVDYAGFQADRAALKKVLADLSAVSPAEFDGWSKPQQ